MTFFWRPNYSLKMLSVQLALLLSLVIRLEAAGFLLVSNIELFELFDVAEPSVIEQTFISCKFHCISLLLATGFRNQFRALR